MGGVRFGRRPIKNFQKFPRASSSLFTKDYLPYLTSLLPPTFSLPTQHHPVHSESVVLFSPLRKSLFLRPERERCHRRHRSSSSSSRQCPSGIACSQHFFFGHSSSSTSSLVPAPTVCPSSQSARPSTHQICLPGLPRDFVSYVCCRLDPTTPGQTASVLSGSILFVSSAPRLSIVGLEILCLVPGLP